MLGESPESAQVQLTACRHPRLIRALEAQTAHASVAISVAQVAEIPFYATLDSAQRRETQGVNARAWRLLLKLWEEGREPNERELERYPIVAVQEGVVRRPLDAVVLAWQVGARTTMKLIMEFGARVLDTEDLRSLTLVLMRAVERLIGVVIAAHTAAVRKAEPREHAVRDLLTDLLTGRYASVEALRGRASSMGIGLSDRPSILLAKPNEGRPSIDESRLLAALGGCTEGHAMAALPIDRGLAVIDANMDTQRLRQALDSVQARGVRVVAEDLGSLREAFGLCREVLSLPEGRSPISGDHILIEDAEARLLIAVTGSSQQQTFEPAAVLRTLLDPGNEATLTALAAYFEHGSSAGASRALSLHPQTIRKHLRRVKEATGRDPAGGWDRFILESALMAAAVKPRGISTVPPR